MEWISTVLGAGRPEPAPLYQIPLPFYPVEGDERRCVQAALKQVIVYFLGVEHSFDELDRRTGRPPGCLTWTAQAALLLDDLGLRVKLYTATPLDLFLQGPEFLEDHFGPEEAARLLEASHWPAARFASQQVLERGLHACPPPGLEELEDQIARGRVPLVLLDLSKLSPLTTAYHGHFVPLTGFDDEAVYYHESSPLRPQAHQRLLKTDFLRAWASPATDRNLLLVSGLRSAFA